MPGALSFVTWFLSQCFILRDDPWSRVRLKMGHELCAWGNGTFWRKKRGTVIWPLLGSWGSVGGWVARAQVSPCEAGSAGSDRQARQLQGCRANPRLRLPPPQSPSTICVGEPSLPRVWNGASSRAHSTPQFTSPAYLLRASPEREPAWCASLRGGTLTAAGREGHWMITCQWTEFIWWWCWQLVSGWLSPSPAVSRTQEQQAAGSSRRN